MKKIKTITFRLDEEEHEKLLRFAQKQKLSLNNILKKAIQLNFNFKAQDVIKTIPFLSSDLSEASEDSAVDKATLYAALEALAIMRELARKEGGDLLKNAKEYAKQKVSELTE